MSYELLVLRLLHILCGAIWFGGSFVSIVWFNPAMIEAGAAAAPVFAVLKRRKLMQIMPLIALVTLVTGFRLMAIASGGNGAGYFQTANGRTLAIGGGLAVLAFLFGMFVARPLAMAGKPGAVPAGYVTNGLLFLAAAAMAVARYLT
jgi:hypothetical protein